MIDKLRRFLLGVASDVVQIGRLELIALAFVVFITYGLWMVHFTTPFELYSYKSNALCDFLTYYFQNRGGLGLAVLPFTFNPFFMTACSLALLFADALLLRALFVRVGVRRLHAFVGVCVWMTAPFFYGYSTYGQGMVVSAAAIGIDIVAMFVYDEFMVRRNRLYLLAFCLFVAIVCSFYEAHVSLLLTGCLGLMWFRGERDAKSFFSDILLLASVLFVGIVVWAICHMALPSLVAKIGGIQLPPHGGAHNTIYWLDGRHDFVTNCKSFAVGLLINWVYTSLFVYGLRTSLFLFIALTVVLFNLLARRKLVDAAYMCAFLLSIFAFPLLQCSSSNFRTQYFFMPFVGFGTVMLLHGLKNGSALKCIILIFMVCMSFLMARETSSLYYYRWKVSRLDDMHWSNVMSDLWRRYGLNVEKPVLFVGGFNEYPGTWDDLRPNRHLPLLNNPFPAFSYFSAVGVPREQYIVLVQKLGATLTMPEYSLVDELKSQPRFQEDHAGYPHEGYIYEVDDYIVVNLGHGGFPKFCYENYANNSEKRVNSIFCVDAFDKWLYKVTAGIRSLATEYPWVWSRRGGS